ncbi:MAG: hypothetical protein AMXMBFR84_49740 [Candidatus Hydrogenedentota bacterium]
MLGSVVRRRRTLRRLSWLHFVAAIVAHGISIGVDAVSFGGLDEGVVDGGGASSVVASQE